MSDLHPPRLAEALLCLVLPSGGYAESVVGDMHEAFQRRAADPAVGPEAARRWYRRHALRIGAGYAWRRLITRRKFEALEAPGPVGKGTGGWGMETLWQDARFAVRSYRRSPGLTLVALVTLALAVGANTAVFSVVDAVYLKSLPFEDPGRLVRIGLNTTARPDALNVNTAGGFQEWSRRARSFESMAAWGYRTVTLERGDVAQQVTVALSVGSLFDVLGRQALIGRTFTAEEEGPGEEGLAVLSHGFWASSMNGADVVGTTVRIWGSPYEIIGVMPRDFQYPRAADVWITAPMDAEMLAARDNYFLRTVARLKEGVSVTQAREEMALLAADVQERFPETHGDVGIAVEPMEEWLRAGAGDLWVILMAGVGIILVIGCVNLANLLLSRGTRRRTEFAVRRALGAGGGRLVRQTLTESLVLALAGGGLGVLAGLGFLELILRWMPGGVPRAESVTMDLRVLAFTLAVSGLAGLLFGVLPAGQARREAIGPGLTRSGRAGWLRNGLVVSEVALALLLLAAGGLTLRSYMALDRQDPGIDVEQLVTFPLTISGDRTPAERHDLYRSLEERLARLQGVASVGVVSTLPVTDFTPGAWVNEPGVEHQGGDRPGAKYMVVSPGYFETAGIELSRGRLLGREDGVDGTRSVVISQAAARELFPGEDALGKRFDLGLDGNIAPLSTVVGVVSDVRLNWLDEPPPPTVYAVQELVPWWEGFQVLLRLEPGAAVPGEIREVVREVDPGAALLGVNRFESLLTDSLGQRRNTMYLFGLVGVVALLMSGVGVFGVLAYLIGSRVREIGVRMALGADRGSVRRLVLVQGMLPVLLGLALGLVGAVALGRFMESLIFGVRPVDPMSLAAVAALLLMVAGVAIYIPARRASRVDPVRVLAAE